MDSTEATPTKPSGNASVGPSPSDHQSDIEEPSDAHQSLLRGTGGATPSGKGERSSFILMRKSSLAFLAFLLLLFVIAFGYFFSEWMYEREFNTANNGKPNCFLEEEFDCPYSKEDIDNLTSEIDRLEGLNKQLSNQLDDYEDLNNMLNASIDELKRQNDILSDSNDRYEELNNQLNDTIAELKEQNLFLEEQVDIFTGLNQDLNATVIDLTKEVDRLEGQVSNFTAENDRLEKLVDSLTDETNTLKELSDVLQTNVDRLEGDIASLERENNRLDTAINDLKTVIEFWDDVSGNFDETYEEMAAFLASQIETNRLMVLEALENTYHQRVAGWDCALRDQFAMEAFANNDDEPIPADRFGDVMEYVDERVLSDLCLDKSNFEDYLEGRYTGMNDMTVRRLVTSVQSYTWSAIDHYFPEKGEIGLSPEDWAAADYDCGKLTAAQKYSEA